MDYFPTKRLLKYYTNTASSRYFSCVFMYVYIIWDEVDLLLFFSSIVGRQIHPIQTFDIFLSFLPKQKNEWVYYDYDLVQVTLYLLISQYQIRQIQTMEVIKTVRKMYLIPETSSLISDYNTSWDFVLHFCIFWLKITFIS